MNKKTTYFIVGILFMLAFSCKKDDPINPYEGINVIQNDNPNANDLPLENFAWLQARIFKPTCANSGCHDGTFEPKFNNIASSYNSIVNHPVIINDELGSFDFRVVPGNSSASLLVERMEVFIPNTSGIMPLEANDSDFLDNQDFYIAKIKEWINLGAKDMYGNPAPSADADFPPQVDGFVVFPSGNITDPYIRDPDEIGITPILVEAATIDLWIRVSDDNTSVQSMDDNQVKLSTDINGFDSVSPSNYTVESPIMALDFANGAANFYHKVTVDLSSASTGEVYFVRNYLDDYEQSSVTELPNAGSNDVISALFVLKIQ